MRGTVDLNPALTTSTRLADLAGVTGFDCVALTDTG
jgi:hypothetical protein